MSRSVSGATLDRMLGLPDTISACLFDLDGVLTKTATVHARAWKAVFDEFLTERGEPPFELPGDYDEFVDGKPRFDGVRSFLQSRAIDADEARALVHGQRIRATGAPGLHAALDPDGLLVALVEDAGTTARVAVGFPAA